MKLRYTSRAFAERERIFSYLDERCACAGSAKIARAAKLANLIVTFRLLALAALASEASGQRGHPKVRAPDTRPDPGSSARVCFCARSQTAIASELSQSCVFMF